jgi:integrase
MRARIERRAYKGKLDLPKANKPRLIVLTPQARDAVLPLDRSKPIIFTAKRGGPLSQSGLTWYWRPVAARFGRKTTPYELRHFAAHYLYVTHGLPARVVAAQLGHGGPKLVEELYGHGD